MFLYPAKSYNLRHATGGETIQHIAYVFPATDGTIQNSQAPYAESWFSGPSADQATIYVDSVAAGRQTLLGDKIYLGALPDTSYWESIGYVDSGDRRQKLYIRGFGAADSGDYGDWSLSTAACAGNAAILSAVEYTSIGGGYYLSYGMREYAAYPDDYYVYNNATYYSDVYSGDEEGYYIQWDLEAWAEDVSGAATRHANTSMWTREFRQQKMLYWDGPTSWSNFVGWNTGTTVDSSSANNTDAMESKYPISGNWIMGRSFLRFDMSDFGSGRTLLSGTLQVYGATEADSRCQLFLGTQADTLTTADFDNYDYAISNAITWTTSDIDMELTATGVSYVNTQLAAASSAKFCIREYDFDVLSTAPPQYSATPTDEFSNSGAPYSNKWTIIDAGETTPYVNGTQLVMEVSNNSTAARSATVRSKMILDGDFEIYGWVSGSGMGTGSNGGGYRGLRVIEPETGYIWEVIHYWPGPVTASIKYFRYWNGTSWGYTKSQNDFSGLMQPYIKRVGNNLYAKFLSGESYSSASALKINSRFMYIELIERAIAPKYNNVIIYWDYFRLASGTVLDTDIKNGMYFSEQAPSGSTIYSPRLKIVYNKAAEWTNKTSNVNWTTTSGSYAGGTWSSESGTIDISDAGSWTSAYRPVGISVKHSNPGTLALNLYDADGEIIATSSDYTSENPLTIVWRGTSNTYDIDRLTLTAGSAFTVSKIQFLEP